jgi:iron complex transport system ATP-binding protein
LGALNEDDRRIITEALEQTGMAYKRSWFFNELSDGEKQRVLISKALAQQTPYVFLDEPTAHLDLPNRIKTLLFLREMAHKTGRCVVISTHELDLALQTADIIWLMTPGEGVAVGTPKELVTNGDFQHAFADPHFRFEEAGGALRIQISESL